MGCSSPQNAGIPNIPSHHYQRLMQVSQINNQLNVNKKYQHISRINLDLQVGKDYKRTYAYDCTTTKEDLEKKRKQFWETRTNGNAEIWNTIKTAIYQPNCISQLKVENMGRAILNQRRIIMLNNSIQMCVDAKLNKYQVPIFCINQPLSYSHVNFLQKNITMTYEDEELEIKIRSAKFPNEDLVIKQQASTQIQTIKSTIRALKELPNESKIRLFYNGREMGDEKSLGNYGFVSGLIIQAMIT